MKSTPLKCGQCGNDTVKLYADTDDSDRDHIFKLVAVCQGCKERTYIEVQPRIHLRAHPDNSGRLCVGWTR